MTRQSETNIVTGATSRDDNGNVYVRREIRDLMDNYPDQWSLYMLALDSLHRADQSDPFSFYGLASIHGRPYKTWGDAPGLPEKIGKAGYCPHDNELFLGWHRPYLADILRYTLSVYSKLFPTTSTISLQTPQQINLNATSLPPASSVSHTGTGLKAPSSAQSPMCSYPLQSRLQIQRAYQY